MTYERIITYNWYFHNGELYDWQEEDNWPEDLAVLDAIEGEAPDYVTEFMLFDLVEQPTCANFARVQIEWILDSLDPGLRSMVRTGKQLLEERIAS